MATLTTSWQVIGSNTWWSSNQAHLKTYARLVSQDISANTSRVELKVTTWTDYSGYASYSTSASCSYTSGASLGYYTWSTREDTIIDQTVTISHNSDGTKSVSGTSSITAGGVGKSGSHSWSFTLPTIPRAATASVSNYTITSTSGSMSFTVTSKADFYQVVTASLAGTTVYSGSLHVNATTATVTVANSKLLAALPSATSGTLTVKVKTYKESGHTTQIGDTQTATATVTVGTQIAPAVSSAVLAVNTTPLSGVLVAGYSTLKVSWGTSAGYGASVSKVAWSVSGTSFSGTGTSASGSATTGTVPSLSYDYAVKATVTVTDSRGRTASATSAGLTVKWYTPPSLSVSFYRVASDTSTTEDQSGAYTYAAFSAAVSSLSDSGNAITSLTGTYSGSLTGSAATGEHKSLAIDKTATLTVTAKDTVGGTVSRTVTVGVSAIPFDLYDDSAGSVGVGLGGAAIAGQTHSYLPFNGTSIAASGAVTGASVTASGTVKGATVQATSTLTTKGITVHPAVYQTISVPTSGWSSRALSGTTYQHHAFTLGTAINWRSVSLILVPANGVVLTEAEAAARLLIKHQTLDDANGKTLRLYATSAPSTALKILVRGNAL